ncbi:ribonuclease kappa-B-like [Tachypleus tridentatus]|uniref:ribonuclease kappa-B-like n=1 Tax=Tachypleus tridentatus TaxID=6853 RepID=UPI003FD1B69C
MRICGPKTSVCCIILSVWGIIMLVLMGIFLYTQSVALAEDLPYDEKVSWKTPQEFLNEAERLYSKSAYNCWIAACLYVVTLVISFQQYYANRKASYTI